MINEQTLKHSNKLNQKYQKNSVTNDNGIQNQSSCYSIAVLIRVEAKIQAVIMGAIADSSTATWITFDAAAKLQHTTRKSSGRQY
jgi:hypothetical protein